MASQDAPQWTCRGCRDGLTAPSSHNHRRGSCQYFFDPNQAATNVNIHSKPMSSVATPRCGAGSTPRRPRNHLVKEEDWAPETKRLRARGPSRISRDYGRDRYLAFQAPIRSSFDRPSRTRK